MSGKVGYFRGVCYPNWLTWQAGSVAGILLASQVPASWGVGFAGTLALLAVMIPLVVNAAALGGAIVAGAVGVAAYGLPYKLGMLLALVAGMSSASAIDMLRKGAADMNAADIWLTIGLLALATVLTRSSFFMLASTRMPARLQQALRYAPAAALAAVVLPDLVLNGGAGARAIPTGPIRACWQARAPPCSSWRRATCWEPSSWRWRCLPRFGFFESAIERAIRWTRHVPRREIVLAEKQERTRVLLAQNGFSHSCAGIKYGSFNLIITAAMQFNRLAIWLQQVNSRASACSSAPT